MAFHQCFQNHFRGFRGFRGQTAKPKSNSNSKFHCQNYSLAEVNERVIWWRKQISDDTKISSLGASLLNTFPKHLYTSIHTHPKADNLLFKPIISDISLFIPICTQVYLFGTMISILYSTDFLSPRRTK